MEIAGGVIAAIEGCFKVATSIESIISNYSNADRYVLDLRRTCKSTKENLAQLRSTLEHGPLGDSGHGPGRRRRNSILAQYYDAHDDFDERLDTILTELKGFDFSKGSANVTSRMQMIWKRPRIEDMKNTIRNKSSDMQLLLFTIQMQRQELEDRRRKPPRSNEERQGRLLESISSGDEDRVKTLLRDGTPLKGVKYAGFWTTPLHVAAEIGSMFIVQLLLDPQHRADINARNAAGATPLMRAISTERGLIAALLLDRGARVDIADELGKTALHYAVANQQVDVVSWLLEGRTMSRRSSKATASSSFSADSVDSADDSAISVPQPGEGTISKRANANAQDKSGETPLGEALRLGSGNEAILEALLDAGADPSIGNEVQYTPLHRAAEANLGPQLQLLVDHVQPDASQLNVTTISQPSAGLYGHTPLWAAVNNGHRSAAEILLHGGADPSPTCDHPDSPTPLWAAFTTNHHALATLLLAHHARPDDRNADGQTILHRTRHRDYPRWAALLLRHGAAASGLADNSGREPVHYAAADEHPRALAALRVLVGAHADLDAQDGVNARTALMAAAARRDGRLALQLLVWGARWEPVDGGGRDAFYLACMAGDVEVAGYLLLAGRGAPLNRVARKGRTPLHIAAKYGRREMVGWLLRHGADREAVLVEPFAGCKKAGTPAEVAREMGHVDVARDIEEFKSDGRELVGDAVVAKVGS